MNIKKRFLKKAAIVGSFLLASYMCTEVTYTESYTKEELNNDKEMMKYLEENNYFEKLKEEKDKLKQEDKKDNISNVDDKLKYLDDKYGLEEQEEVEKNNNDQYIIEIKSTVFKKTIRDINKFFKNI
ncbi:hypothetical protein WG909_13175 [Peptostreptococcaceae bacterium AGR-M142]